MTEKKFLNTLAKGKGDFLQMFLDVLKAEADILRLMEAKSELGRMLPQKLKKQLF